METNAFQCIPRYTVCVCTATHATTRSVIHSFHVHIRKRIPRRLRMTTLRRIETIFVCFILMLEKKEEATNGNSAIGGLRVQHYFMVVASFTVGLSFTCKHEKVQDLWMVVGSFGLCGMQLQETQPMFDRVVFIHLFLAHCWNELWFECNRVLGRRFVAFCRVPYVTHCRKKVNALWKSLVQWE